LSWPGDTAGWEPEFATNLAPVIFWHRLTNDAVLSNGRHRVFLAPAETQRYFRLRWP